MPAHETQEVALAPIPVAYSTHWLAPSHTNLIILFNFQLSLLTQFLKTESALLVQHTTKLVQPGTAALADPVGGSSNIGWMVPLVRGYAFQQGPGEALEG